MQNSFRTIFLISFFSIAFAGCKEYKRNSTHKNVSLSSIKKGEVLAAKYCQSCHLLPDPSLLDANSWEKGVLPNMGPRLGIFHYGFNTYPSSKNDINVDPNFYPSKPSLSMEEWQNIIDYYSAISPDNLPKQNRSEVIKPDLPLFTVQLPEVSYQNPTTSLVQINSFDSLYPLIISDVNKRKIFFFNPKLDIDDSISTDGPVVDIELMKEGMLVCNIGVLNPNNGKFGKGQFIKSTGGGKLQVDSMPLFDNLRRPVQLTSVDINNDGRKDYIVCEFGNLMGGLYWMEYLGNNNFAKHIIRDYPGAIKAYIDDYNHDGAPDIWALFAQGEEGIFLFTNDGKGNFDSKEVLRFPSVYGSSYFELTDFNKDGYPDIVYTCGDNADYSVVLKPYHGVYIFLNDKSNQFKQQYFFPIHGCYKAIAKDYDDDGDLDIAAISFFADYEHQPEEGFVYLENTGESIFHPYTFPEAVSGRWLTMDAGDINGDGKIDLVLGNFTLGPSPLNSEENGMPSTPFVVLKNKGRK